MIELVESAVVGDGEDSLFRNDVVQLKLAQLEVEPWAATDVVDPGHDGFEVKSAGRIGRGQEVERIVLVERAAGMEVQTAQIEAVVGDFLRNLVPLGPSIATWLVLSRCQFGVMRNVTGQYDGFCQIGESRSFINW